MPFNQMVDVLVKYSIDDKETPKKHISLPQRLEDKVTKKIKWFHLLVNYWKYI